MNWYTGLMVYIIIWWCVLFCVLPLGVRTPEEAGEPAIPGQAPSAPVRPQLLLKAGLATGISAVLFIAFYFAQRYDVFGIGAYWRRE